MAFARTTVYLHPKIYRAAKVKAALTGKTLSEMVNDSLVVSLREDQADLEAFDRRRGEPSRPFEDVLSELKRDGLL